MIQQKTHMTTCWCWNSLMNVWQTSCTRQKQEVMNNARNEDISFWNIAYWPHSSPYHELQINISASACLVSENPSDHGTCRALSGFPHPMIQAIQTQTLRCWEQYALFHNCFHWPTAIQSKSLCKEKVNYKVNGSWWEKPLC